MIVVVLRVKSAFFTSFFPHFPHFPPPKTHRQSQKMTFLPPKIQKKLAQNSQKTLIFAQKRPKTRPKPQKKPIKNPPKAISVYFFPSANTKK
jgi:hypothetical protein